MADLDKGIEPFGGVEGLHTRGKVWGIGTMQFVVCIVWFTLGDYAV